MGQNSGSISNSTTTTTTLNGADNIGGLVGYNTGSISNTNASSNITTSGYNWGPLVGSLISNILLKENGGKLEIYINNNNWSTNYEYKNEIIINESYLNESKLSNGGLLSSSSGVTRVKSNFKIYFDTDGETAFTISNLPSGINYKIPSYYKYGYTLIGWKSGNTLYKANSNFITPANNVTFTTWYSVNTYNIEFINASNSTTLQNQTFASVITLPNITSCGINISCVGYTFGWNSGNTIYKANSNFIIPANNVTLTAWYSLNTYTIRLFNSNESNTLSNRPYGSQIIFNISPDCVPNVNCGGYTFIGWKSGETIYKYGSKFIIPDSDVNFYAEWKKNADANGNGLIEIYNVNDLNNVRYNLNGTSWKTSPTDTNSNNLGCPSSGCRGYELANNIDFAGSKWASNCTGVDCVTSGWQPIRDCGSSNNCIDNPFMATFNGNGFVIRNLYIKSNKDNVGLFGYVSGPTAIIKSLGLENVYIENNENFTGSLVGYLDNGGTIIQSHSNGKVIGNISVGGLVGYSDTGNIISSNVSGSINGENYVGGLVGYSFVNTISLSWVTGVINGTKYVGGLVGYFNTGNLKNNYTYIEINGNDTVGGLIGFLTNSNSIVASNYVIGKVRGIKDIGGLVGLHTQATIVSNNVTGKVSGETDIGGLVGTSKNGTISFSNANTMISVEIKENNSGVGGLVGNFGIGNIKDSYTTGWISVIQSQNYNYYVGGLIGTIKGGEIKNSFSKSNIITTGNNGEIGGFVGHAENTMTYSPNISHCIASGSVNVTVINEEISNCDLKVGGIVGNFIQGNISNCYTTSNILVTSTSIACSNIGEFFGDKAGMINNSLFDINTSGISFDASGSLLQKNSNDVSNKFFGLQTAWLKEAYMINSSSNRDIGNKYFLFNAGFYPKLCNSLVTTPTCSQNDILPGQ